MTYGSARPRYRREQYLAAAAALIALSIVISSAMTATEAHAQTSDLIEEHVFLRVKIGGRTVRLEALVIKRADARGRLPVAFFNHGQPGNHLKALNQSLKATPYPITRDLARRGWLTVAVNRRGFGMSDGAIQHDNFVKCRDLNQRASLEANADDIQAAMEVIAQRPDADPSRIISLGLSAGGSLSTALGARNLPGLILAFNVAGGHVTRMTGDGRVVCKNHELVQTHFHELGTKSRIQNIWIYARNDSLFSLDEIEAMRSSFASGGGKVHLVLLDPLDGDGHLAVGATRGRNKWLAVLDEFLRAQGLPTWPTSSVDTLMQRLRLPETNRKSIESYLGATVERALAKSTSSATAAFDFGDTIEEARKRTLELCQKHAPRCAIVMENDRWVGAR